MTETARNQGVTKPEQQPFSFLGPSVPQISANFSVVMKLPHVQEDQPPFFFEGAYEAMKNDGKGEDCIALFDPATGTFRLERLTGIQCLASTKNLTSCMLLKDATEWGFDERAPWGGRCPGTHHGKDPVS
eukprot:scaffold332820_cov41-Prasinocladus_malaysianus.AAC.1